MGAITACRTAALGGHVEQCDDCGTIRIAYNSCRNRHCPKCQGLARAQWLANRRAELLPVPYFHLVFTLPAPAGEIAFQNKAVVYAILFRTAAETLATIAADPRHLGAQLGVIAVLHTWGQTLQHHPHVHCVVLGGGPSLDGTHWVACQPGFFLPVRVLSRLVVGDKSAAEDLVSEVFLDVWRQAGRFQGRSQVTTWLLAMARNKALSAYCVGRSTRACFEFARLVCSPLRPAFGRTLDEACALAARPRLRLDMPKFLSVGPAQHRAATTQTRGGHGALAGERS
jgi:hypothetical protein